MAAPDPMFAPVTSVWLTVQKNVAPATLLVNPIEVVVPVQIVCDTGGAIATGVGFTVIVTKIGIPEQPLQLD